MMGLADADTLLPVFSHLAHVAGRMPIDDVVMQMEVWWKTVRV